jgi:hypothetical protein
MPLYQPPWSGQPPYPGMPGYPPVMPHAPAHKCPVALVLGIVGFVVLGLVLITCSVFAISAIRSNLRSTYSQATARSSGTPAGATPGETLIYQNSVASDATGWTNDAHCSLGNCGYHVKAEDCFGPTGTLVTLPMAQATGLLGVRRATCRVSAGTTGRLVPEHPMASRRGTSKSTATVFRGDSLLPATPRTVRCAMRTGLSATPHGFIARANSHRVARVFKRRKCRLRAARRSSPLPQGRGLQPGKMVDTDAIVSVEQMSGLSTHVYGLSVRHQSRSHRYDLTSPAVALGECTAAMGSTAMAPPTAKW